MKPIFAALLAASESLATPAPRATGKAVQETTRHGTAPDYDYTPFQTGNVREMRRQLDRPSLPMTTPPQTRAPPVAAHTPPP